MDASRGGGVTSNIQFETIWKKTMMYDFVVVEEDNLYQMIFGRPFLRISKSIRFDHYLALECQVNRVVGVVKGWQENC